MMLIADAKRQKHSGGWVYNTICVRPTFKVSSKLVFNSNVVYTVFKKNLF